MDKKKIIKILQKTTSDNDHEALAFIRFANKMLKNEDLHWDEFFSDMTSDNSNPFATSNDSLVRSLKKKINRLEREAAFHINEKEKTTQLEGKVIKLENELRYYKNKDIKIPKSPFLEDFPGSHKDVHSGEANTKDKIDISLDALPHNAFLHSVNDFWENYGYLTPRQMDVLNSIYSNL